MLKVDKVVQVLKNIDAELMIITRDQKIAILSAPDKNGFRDIVFDGGKKARGILCGSWDGKKFKTHYSHQFPLVEIVCDSQIKIDCGLVMLMPVSGFPRLNYPLIIDEPVASIYIKRRYY